MQHTAEPYGDEYIIHYTVTGKVVNTGDADSGIIRLSLTINESSSGRTLYHTTFSPTPVTLHPKESGTYSVQFSSTDMGMQHTTTDTPIDMVVKVESQ